MTPLWILRHDGAVLACAPSNVVFACLKQGERLGLITARSFDSFADMIESLPDQNRYTVGKYTLALEPHPTPGARDG